MEILGQYWYDGNIRDLLHLYVFNIYRGMIRKSCEICNKKPIDPADLLFKTRNFVLEVVFMNLDQVLERHQVLQQYENWYVLDDDVFLES